MGFLCSGKRRTRICSGENMLWGEEENSKKEGFWKIFGKIGENLKKIEEISGDFAVKKKQFRRQ